MIKNLKLLTGGILMASFVLSPMTGFAKNNDRQSEAKERKNEKTELREELREEKNCLGIFSHLVGGKNWKVEDREPLEKCWLPFGIAKKWNGKASTTIDASGPIITNLSATTTTNRAIIKWNTDERASSEIYYGTTTPVSMNSPANLKSGWRKLKNKEHTVVLKNLTPNTTYYLVVKSKDKSGNITLSNQISFTTKTKTVDALAPTISNVVTILASSTIKVAWRTNEPSSSRIYYGAGPINVNATSTLRVENATLKTNHVLTIPNLSANTNYYMIIESSDESNNKRFTDQFEVKTLSI